MGSNEQMGAGLVRIVSRRMIRPPSEEPVLDIHLTPWDLRLISIDYIQKGILLPKPPVGRERLVDALASSFERALSRFYPFAGRLVVEHHDGGRTIAVLLRCTGEGAEFIHAAAPGVAVADIAGSIRVPPVVCDFFPLNHVLDADAAVDADAESTPMPVLSAQVTELADGVFIGMWLNHTVGDGTAFWEFFNVWSEINRGGEMISMTRPAPVPQRFFLDGYPVPVRMPFGELRHVVRRFERPTVEECFFTFSVANIRKLKARASDEIMAAATVSSLQALLAHLWRAVSRARRLPSEQETYYTLVIGCRGRVGGIPAEGYMGNAVAFGKAVSVSTQLLDSLNWIKDLIYNQQLQRK